jgi:hypothetical protein
MKLKNWAIAGFSAMVAIAVSISSVLAETIEVTVNDLKVRKGPGITYPVLTQFDKGVRANKIKQSGSWAYIVTGRVEGWVYAPYIKVASTETGSSGSLTQLFSRVWRVTKAPSQPASGSIYAFLPNGTLIQTSCTEPYRIASWTIDKAAPRTLRVVEDRQLAYTATIAQLTDTTLQLQQTLVRSNEKRAITLTAVQQEFVCPDLPR